MSFTVGKRTVPGPRYVKKTVTFKRNQLPSQQPPPGSPILLGFLFLTAIFVILTELFRLMMFQIRSQFF